MSISIYSPLSGDVVKLASIDLTFPIEQIYEDIIFEAEEQIKVSNY